MITLKSNQSRGLRSRLKSIIETNNYENFKRCGTSIRLREKMGGYYNCEFTSTEDVSCLLEDISSEVRTLVFSGTEYINEVKKIFPEAVVTDYVTMVINDLARIPDLHSIIKRINIKNYEITPISIDWLDYIDLNYKSKEFEREYLKNRIEKDLGFGLFINNEKKGFILIHKNCDIGPIFLDREYRGTGLADILTVTLLRKLIEQGRTPYLLIDKKNICSIKQAERCGFEKADYQTVMTFIPDEKGNYYKP